MFVFICPQVGYRSSLSSSQSITDLSHIPEKDTTSMSRLQGTVSPAYFASLPTTNSTVVSAWANKPSCISNSVYSAKPVQAVRPNSISLRPNNTHQSLPESPNYERNIIFPGDLKAPKACSFYVDLTTLPKSESTPALVTKLSAPKNEESEDEGGTFSSDSLEKEELRPPRRCISDYQVSGPRKESTHWVIPLPSNSTPATPRPRVPRKPADLTPKPTGHRVVSRSKSLQDTRNALSRPPTPGHREGQLAPWGPDDEVMTSLSSTCSTPSANSPKRLAARIHPLARRISLRQSLLPSKCQGQGSLFYFFAFLCNFYMHVFISFLCALFIAYGVFMVKI